MVNCSFCGNEVVTGAGFVLFKKDGSAVNYCSRKCERNAEMGRNPRKFKWTKKFVTASKR